MKVLYKLYISSIEQSGYHTVVTNNESYRVSIKDINALEKKQLICLESPLLAIDPEISTQITRTNFLTYCLWRTKCKFTNKGKQGVILNTSNIHFLHILAFIHTRSKGINFCKTFRIWVECAINRMHKNWYEYRVLVCQNYFIRLFGEYGYTF